MAKVKRKWKSCLWAKIIKKLARKIRDKLGWIK